MFNNCVLFNAKKLERKLTCIAEQEFANIGLHHTYAYILTVIAKAEYTKTKNISCALGLDSSTVTRMVSKLEKEGLVQKGSANSPVEISLTAAGKQVIPEITKAWDSYHQRIEQLLGQAEAEELVALLTAYNQKLDK